jgi:autotransporter passenger strand-loop-strand repeat protein
MTTQFVGSGVVSSGVIVSSGNILEVLSGGTADVTSVTSGGIQQVDAGGFASGTVISAGGSDTVFGLDTGATVNSGGREIVFGGGTVSAATVNSGGLLIVEGGRSWLSGASINSGGTLVLSGGFGPEFFTNVVNNGTIDFDNAGGTMSVASGTGVIEVTDGAALQLSLTSSSNFTGSFVIGGGGVFGGGQMELTSAGAALGRPIDLAAAGADLRIDGTVMPSDVISGFVPVPGSFPSSEPRSTQAAALRCCPAMCCRSSRAAPPTICNSIHRSITRRYSLPGIVLCFCRTAGARSSPLARS